MSLPVHLPYQSAKDEPVAETNQMRAAVGTFPFTPADIEGPYFKDNSPHRADVFAYNDSVEPVQTLRIRVTNKKGEPLENARVDVWLADRGGKYSGFADQGTDGQDWCRGHQFTAADGRCEFRLVRPGHYKISDTEERTAHVHMKVRPPAGTPLTTQLYFPDDPGNATDPWEQKSDPLLLLTPDGAAAWAFDVVCKTFH